MNFFKNSKVKVKKFKEFREFNDFFVIANSISFTLCIDVQQRYKKLSKFFRALLTFMIGIHLYCRANLLLQLYRHILERDILKIFRVGVFITYALDSNIKFLTLILNLERVRKIYNTLKENYPKTIEDKQAFQVNQHYAISGKPKWLCINLITCWFIMFASFFETWIRYAYDRFTKPTDEVELQYMKPYPIDHFYDYQHVPIYILTYALELINAVITVNSVLVTDTWIICFIAQICMQCQYIVNSLENYKPAENNEKKDCKFLASLVEKHKLMLSLQNDINEIFGTSLACTILITSGLMVVNAIQLTVEELDGSSLYLWGLFLLTTIGEFYLLCSSGQKLKTTSTEIANAAYKSEWYNGSAIYKKLLLLVIVRAQKEAELSAKGFCTIQMELFQNVMNMTYRVFTVLQSMI